MNTKGQMTDVILVLILSGITVALIFVGIIYTYTSLACYVGVDTKATTISGPFAGQAAAADITLDTTYYITNKSDCTAKCCYNCKIDNTQDPPVRICPQDNTQAERAKCVADGVIGRIGGYNMGCLATCNKMAEDTNYITYLFHVTYSGAQDSVVVIEGAETQKGMDVPISLLSDSTPSTMHTSDEYTFAETFVMSKPCSDVFDVNVSQASYPIPSDNFHQDNDFCLSPAARDINVSVNNVYYSNDNDVTAKVSITGSDVASLCPNADASFYLRETDTENGLALITNDSGVCAFTIDTNATRADNNQWYSDDFTFRTKLTVNNTAGMDITQDELVEAYVDFSREKLGFEPNLTSCAEALIVTKADGVTPLDYSFKKAPTDYKGHCSGVGLWFNWGYNRLDDIDKIWKKDQIKTFYVYTTNKSITELKVTDVSKYYTSYVWTDFTKKNDTYTSGVNIYSAAKPYSVNLSCQPCGLEGQSCCEPGDKCATPSSLTCNSSKLCEPCGQVGQTCCAGGYACGGSGTYGACAIGACCNTSNKCYTCGKLDQACCPSNKCSNAAYGCNTALDPDACKYKLKCWKVRHCGNGWGDGCGSCDTGIACQDTAPTCKYGKCDLSGDDTCTANSFTRCDTKYWHSRHCGAGLLDICGKCDTGNNCSTTAPTCQYNDCKPPFGSGGKLTCTADTYSTGGYGTV